MVVLSKKAYFKLVTYNLIVGGDLLFNAPGGFYVFWASLTQFLITVTLRKRLHGIVVPIHSQDDFARQKLILQGRKGNNVLLIFFPFSMVASFSLQAFPRFPFPIMLHS